MNREVFKYHPRRFFRNIDYKEVAKDVAIYTPVMLTGAALGAARANQESPAKVLLSDKIEAQVALDFGGQGLNVEYGSVMHFPNAIDGLLKTIHTGVNIDINTINASTEDPKAIKEFSALAAQYKPNIIEPMQEALVNRLLTGATLGALALTATFAASVATYKHIKKNGGLPYVREKARQSRMRTKILTGLCAAAAIFSTGNAIKNTLQGPNEVQKNVIKKPMPKQLTNKSPLLEGAWMEGLGSEIPEKLAKAFIAYKNDVNESLDISKRSFEEQFEKYSEKKSSLINNPNLRPVMHISDAHCNYAMYEKTLTPVVEAFRPSLILNTGDTFTNGGSMPYENNCFKDFRGAIAKGNKQSTIINTIGNHDPKDFINIDSYPKVITPTKDDGYKVKTEIGDIIVTEDKSSSKWKATPEEKTNEMYELNAKQGHITAEKACEAAKEDVQRPIVMVHRPQASFETSMRGCARLILKGHLHKNLPLKKVVSKDGQEVIHHTAGSSSGTHNTIAIYETPKRSASISILHFDKYNELQGATTIKFTSDGEVAISDEKMPSKVDIDISKAQLAFTKKYGPKKTEG